MAHRLISGKSEACAIPHGHNEYVTLFLAKGVNHQGDRLDAQANMLMPFAEAKKRWHHFIDNHVDHVFQLSDKDPLIDFFQTKEPERLKRIMVTPGDPTTEMLAALLLAKANQFLKEDGSFLQAKAILIQETPTNSVRFEGNPADILPSLPKKENGYWWERADNSISDF
ncbi:6-pyruvoyl tetrahydropterin synthase [Lasius niger]|uniref:6-pyruvoyltetrahydropterin synthase n=1 Tax=Lasius niger TaxID=67767 RepID=A0A0J7KQQ8_LASNI|nr:6-pyruvoyl tetrahydropterin synthase [Lasius niger]